MTIYVDWEGFPWRRNRNEERDALTVPSYIGPLIELWYSTDDPEYAGGVAAVIEATVESSPVRDRLAKYIRKYEEQ